MQLFPSVHENSPILFFKVFFHIREIYIFAKYFGLRYTGLYSIGAYMLWATTDLPKRFVPDEIEGWLEYLSPMSIFSNKVSGKSIVSLQPVHPGRRTIVHILALSL
jgi:hypothetical protein